MAHFCYVTPFFQREKKILMTTFVLLGTYLDVMLYLQLNMSCSVCVLVHEGEAHPQA